MSIRPIEPGCLALVIDSAPQIIGLTVVVLERSDISAFDWRVSPANGAAFPPPVSRISALALDRQLLRIDGGEDESITTEQDSEVTA